MSPRTRVAVVALVLLSILGVVVLLAFATNACPGDTAALPCPSAGSNRAIVVSLLSVSSALLVAPFAFLAEFALRHRIVYRGAWGRAARRAALTAAVVGSLAGLRLGGALSSPGALFVVSLAGAVEWLAVRRFDLP